MTDIDDGSDKPLGFTTNDGELEVREVDGEKHYCETELGQHQRWMRQAPDLFALHHRLLEERRVMVEILQAACDRSWADETPIQVASVASNAIYWRVQEIARLKAIRSHARRAADAFTLYELGAEVPFLKALEQLRTCLDAAPEQHLPPAARDVPPNSNTQSASLVNERRESRESEKEDSGASQRGKITERE